MRNFRQLVEPPNKHFTTIYISWVFWFLLNLYQQTLGKSIHQLIPKLDHQCCCSPSGVALGGSSKRLRPFLRTRAPLNIIQQLWEKLTHSGKIILPFYETNRELYLNKYDMRAVISHHLARHPLASWIPMSNYLEIKRQFYFKADDMK